jgi:hypothetical protein
MTTTSMETGLAYRSLEVQWADLVGFAQADILHSERSQYMPAGALTAVHLYDNYPPEESEKLLRYGSTLILGKLEHVLAVSPGIREQIAQDGGDALSHTWLRDPQRTDGLVPRHLIGLADNWSTIGESIGDAVDLAIEGLRPPTRLACNALTLVLAQRQKEASQPKPKENIKLKRPSLNPLDHDLSQGYDAEPEITLNFFRDVVLVTSKILEANNIRRRSNGEPPITEIGAESLQKNLYPLRLPSVGVAAYPPTTHEGRFDHPAPENEVLEVPKLIRIVVHLMMDSVEVAEDQLSGRRALPSERRFAA